MIVTPLSRIRFEIDNIPYLSETWHNQEKAKKEAHEFTEWKNFKKQEVCDR